MRVCVIGNSHIAARKSAIRDGLVVVDGIDVNFWGMSRGRFESTLLDGGVVRSRFPEMAAFVSEGKYTDLPLDDFDALLFEGTFLPIGDWLRDCRAAKGSIFRLTHCHLRDAVIVYLETCAVFRLARAAAERQRQYVYLSPAPVQALPPGKVELPIPHEEVDLMIGTIAGILGRLSINFLPQPQETLSAGVYTLQQFSDGAVRLSDHSAVLPDDEVIHMNAHYGARTWAAFLSRLAADPETGAAAPRT